jgi:hypothetical protein
VTVDNDGGLKRRKIRLGTLVLGVLAIFVRVAARGSAGGRTTAH